jgi:outer membrane protein OmpA-like peptidoglycan-associated protein
MSITVKQIVTLATIAPLMAGCVKASTYHRDLRDTRSQIASERTDRMAADSSQNADVAGVKSDLAGVKTDVQGLRNDLQNLRTEFGAKITALESGIQFDFPVNFAFDDASVRDQDHDALDRFAGVVQKYYPGSKITIEGFADPAGTKTYNVGLSQRRADAVRDYLVQKGMSTTELKTVGYGKTRLVVPKAAHDDPGAEQNRRVVFVIETKGDNVQPAGKTTASIAGVAGVSGQ